GHPHSAITLVFRRYAAAAVWNINPNEVSMSKQRRWRWVKRLVGLVLILGTAGFGGWYYLQEADNGAPEYQTVTVSRGPLTQVVTANGQLNPVVKVQVGSQISGTIDKLFADFNSKVKEGE